MKLEICHHHPRRPAAARCLGCGRGYCRECVTEHEHRILCAECLAAETQSTVSQRNPWVLRFVSAGLAFLVVWLGFYMFGSLLLRIPDHFHDLESFMEVLE